MNKYRWQNEFADFDYCYFSKGQNFISTLLPVPQESWMLENLFQFLQQNMTPNENVLH